MVKMIFTIAVNDSSLMKLNGLPTFQHSGIDVTFGSTLFYVELSLTMKEILSCSFVICCTSFHFYQVFFFSHSSLFSYKLLKKFNKEMSLCMGKPTICIGEYKGADQLRSNCEADQRLCFRYTDSTIPLLNPKFQASDLLQ